MASPVSRCTTHSGGLEAGGYQMTNFIKANTTPQEFDTERGTSPEYQLTFGGRCGWNALGAAAIKNNVPLIEHIVQAGGQGLLELGNEFGFTPLFCAAADGQYAAADKLIELGADVNKATSLSAGDSSKGNTPAGATPLWAAAQQVQSVALAKLLLKHGAVAEPKLDDAGSQVLEQAKQELVEEREQLVDAIDTGTALCMPLDLVKIIADYAE